MVLYAYEQIDIKLDYYFKCVSQPCSFLPTLFFTFLPVRATQPVSIPFLLILLSFPPMTPGTDAQEENERRLSSSVGKAVFKI